MNTTDLPKVALIAGPTASGKSALALAFAEQEDGVVINADASQVYAELRILTARPSPADEARAPHRLFGYLRGDQPNSAARWAEDATAAIRDAHAAGKLPILVGGTGLYFRTLLDGIAPVPPIDPAIRADVRALPVAIAYQRLQKHDPAAAKRLNANDTTRVARALEVVLSTGRPLAAWHEDRRGGIAGTVTLAPLILLPQRETLYARCDARAAAMLADGALDEVRDLLRCRYAADTPVVRAIGVRELAALLKGTATRAQALDTLRRATRQYAKRQYTWFRHQPPPDWLRIDETEFANINGHIATLLR